MVHYLKRYAFIALLLITYSKICLSQAEQSTINYTELIYFEADPFAFLNNGYSFHLGYENWGMRFDLTKVKVDFPEKFEEGFYNTKKFDLISNINGIKLDYIGNRENWSKNAFLGVDINHQKLSFKHRQTLESKNLNSFNLGLRAGYKIPIYKGFYATPWAAVWKNLKSTQLFEVEGDLVSTNKWDWIVTIHFGYSIKLGEVKNK